MADAARDAGCDLAQGFHFARPERPIRIDELLAAP
jgi:EAL domain-containing protein (putative c-di-GMP-specific phosphodiesterase class I)